MHVLDLPVEIISDNDERDAFRIGVDSDGRYILLDHLDKPIPTFPSSDGPKLLLDRLTLLAKYEMIRYLKNTLENLDGKFEFELVDKCKNPATATDIFLLTPSYSLPTGQTFHCQRRGVVYSIFKNLTGEPVNLTIFDFQPLRGITQIYPLNSDLDTVLPGDERKHGFLLTIPKQLNSISTVSDVLKAFVTIQTTSFRSLEHSDIEPDAARGSVPYQHYDELEQLLNTLDSPPGPSTPDECYRCLGDLRITIRIIRNNSFLDWLHDK